MHSLHPSGFPFPHSSFGGTLICGGAGGVVTGAGAGGVVSGAGAGGVVLGAGAGGVVPEAGTGGVVSGARVGGGVSGARAGGVVATIPGVGTGVHTISPAGPGVQVKPGPHLSSTQILLWSQ